MKVKRFYAPSARQALAKVKQALGEDAVILANKTVNGGVEILAAIDYNEQDLLEQNTPSLVSENTHDSSNVSTTSEVYTHAMHAPQAQQVINKLNTIEWSQDPAMLSVRDEISALRELIAHQLTGLAWNDYQKTQPEQANLLRRLANLGIDLAICREIVAQVARDIAPEQAWQQVLANIVHRLPTLGDIALDQGGIISLIGPTGVGKTTTAAKIAARFAWRYGVNNIGLITTDSFRIAAHEQLRTYAMILGINVRVVDSHEGLVNALNKFRERRLVIIDNPGMGQRDSRLADHVALLTDTGRTIKHLLVLSSTSQTPALTQAIYAYQALQPVAAIITKIDEATSLGPVISTLIKHALPIAYLTAGQRVPEDLTVAEAIGLLEQCIAIAKQYNDTLAEDTLAYAFEQGVVSSAH
ncbi:MAG: hypothetical protein Tsb005_07520 [Gammaproteobacteria bacterium]